ncbi:LAME_0B02278g1_1 [Lachancea meyersii CBS 8951]|uniref:non-specific serine/threonine protein kinase n=1 Tax=Lachancea meyersii CBS 8951 TaxID=1266667 RepID=A0A1G4ITP5_9SACH|nr:LAME_0B02278g1_1 [Lachancea meyersii CBS 8951]
MPYVGAPHNKHRFEAFKEKLSMSKPSRDNKLKDDSSSPSREVLEINPVPRPENSATVERGEATVTPESVSAHGGAPSPQPETSSSLSNSEIDFKELLTFPNESTHAYSYNPLSPNSLAVRLRILKRSLEIMIRNPGLLLEHHSNHSSQVGTPNGSRQDFDWINPNSIKLPERPSIPRSYSQDGAKPLSASRLRNASSAALTALVSNAKGSLATRQSPGRRSGPFQPSALGSRPSTAYKKVLPKHDQLPHPQPEKFSIDSASQLDRGDGETPSEKECHESNEFLEAKNELKSLLALLNDALENNGAEKASDLHMISLLNFSKLSLDVEQEDKSDQDSGERSLKHEDTLKRNLLESLAQPFFENSNASEYAVEAEKILDLDVDTSSIDDNSFSNMRSTSVSTRLIHTSFSSKNSSPQAIFTCLEQYPWQFKSANDLACLTFGISQNALRALTLLDLIHSDSRNFVLNKIMSTDNHEQVFTGEIVAIIQPGESSSDLVWSSVWAKRRNGLIFCVFEKVPCDFMDVLLNLDDFSVDHIAGGAGLKGSKQNTGNSEQRNEAGEKGSKKSVKFPNEIHDIDDLSHSLKKLLTGVENGAIPVNDGDLLPTPIKVSNAINEVRYFTLNHLSSNIPCAISSSILENEIKLKIHSLPYQAGIFFINSKEFCLVSFNKSVAKNMFGLHASELVGKKMSTIIPSFSNMINFIKLKYPRLDILLPKNRGLVLTEHFFRKIQAEMNHKEESYFNSIGIDAVHRDGCVLKVDIQLRVINQTTSLLWITHSRDVVFENYKTTPSQLPMLKESELALVGSGSTSRGSLKTPSGRPHVDELPSLKDSLKLDGSTVGSFENASYQSEGSVAESPDTPTDESSHDSGSKLELKKLNDEIQVKLDITKSYGQDKTLFFKDNNFRLNEDLILSLTANSTEGGEKVGEMFMKEEIAEGRGVGSTQTFVTEPATNIGSLKHVKKFSDFAVLQKMGEGAYGKVDLCMHKKDGYIVVIKLIFKERILVDTWVRDRKLGTIPSEIQIMATLNAKPHENILKLLDFFEDDDYYYIETPVHGLSGSIDLFDLIELKTDMTEHEARLIFKQIVSGIKHLHDNGIVHRDIKDENVIVESNGFVKIVDFGSAAYIKSGPFDVFVGTIDYAAPEVLGGEPYEGKPQDIWAIGILLYTIIFKENPFYNIDEILDSDLRINPSRRVSDDCVSLIRKILNRSVGKRPSIEEICNDKWLEI